MSDARVLPNFLYVGPDKSGSTWMYEMLRQHPECHVPRVKDIYFFDRYYHRGLDWYASFFRDAPPGARAIGELSHDYLFSDEAADRIRHDLPGVRLLVSLRNPGDRSFSQFLYMLRSGMTEGPFAEAVRRYPEIIDNSLYHKHLVRYWERFGTDRLRVFLFDDLVADPRAFAHDLFGYLGLSTDVEMDFSRRVLPASRARSRLAARAAKEGANLARRLGLAELVGAVKGSPVVRWLYAPYGAGERPTLPSGDRTRMLEAFRPDLERLQEAIGRDLGHWMREETP